MLRGSRLELEACKLDYQCGVEKGLEIHTNEGRVKSTA